MTKKPIYRHIDIYPSRSMVFFSRVGGSASHINMYSKNHPRNIPVSAEPRSLLVPENAKTPTQRRKKMKRVFTLPHVKKKTEGKSGWGRCWMCGVEGGLAQRPKNADTSGHLLSRNLPQASPACRNMNTHVFMYIYIYIYICHEV